MGTAVCSDSSPLTSVHLTVGKYQKHPSRLPPPTLRDPQKRTLLLSCGVCENEERGMNLRGNESYCSFINTCENLCVLLRFDLACSADDLPGSIHVSILSHVHHGCPAGSDNSSWPGARYRRWGVYSPLPVWSYKVLVLTVLFITVEDHRGPFGGVAILEKNMMQRWLVITPDRIKDWSLNNNTHITHTQCIRY